ncbi:unnamed protein product [Choristocarpus tenellus]
MGDSPTGGGEPGSDLSLSKSKKRKGKEIDEVTSTYSLTGNMPQEDPSPYLDPEAMSHGEKKRKFKRNKKPRAANHGEEASKVGDSEGVWTYPTVNGTTVIDETVESNPGKANEDNEPAFRKRKKDKGNNKGKDAENSRENASPTVDSTSGEQRVGIDSKGERRRLGKTHGKARKSYAGVGACGEGSQMRGSPMPTSTRDQVDGALCKGRLYTLSIAVPGSVVDNAQNRELKTYLVGEIARAAGIFEVDEIVVYDDLSTSRKSGGGVRDDSSSSSVGEGNDPNVFMARILQYVETPQYLRRKLFPMHPSLRFAGLLNPLDAPHHVRADERSPFREGVVVDKPVKEMAGSFVEVGMRKVHPDTYIVFGYACYCLVCLKAVTFLAIFVLRPL